MKFYTDGSCLGNPGNGGWGVVCVYDDGTDFRLYGGEKKTTNNRMELQAVIEALYLSSGKLDIVIFSDSLYVINCANGKWSRKANLDLWTLYDKLSVNKNIQMFWVKGHNGNKYNEIVDKLAKKGASEIN